MFYLDELHDCLEERHLTIDVLHNTRCTRSILLDICNIMDDLDVSGFWQSLPIVTKRTIKSRCFDQEERRMCIVNSWFDIMRDDVTYYQIIITFNDYSNAVGKILDTLKESMFCI